MRFGGRDEFGRIECSPPKKPGDASRSQELIDRGRKLIDYGGKYD